MLAYLLVVENHCDDLRLKRIIKQSPRRISAKTVEIMEEIAFRDGGCIFDIAASREKYPNSRASAAIESFKDDKGTRGDVVPLPLDEFYDGGDESQRISFPCPKQRGQGVDWRLENIMELKSNIVNYMSNAQQPTLWIFRRNIAFYRCRQIR